MGAKIGDGKKYIRDFAVDFTDKETYIGGKSFPKGYFTAALLNYGKDLVTRMLIAGGHCFQALRALELQTFTLEQFDTLVRITMDIHRDLFKCEPFCHLDVLAEESALNALFSSSVRDSLSAYYDLAVQYSGYDRAELQLSDEELRIEQQGVILEANLLEVMRAYSYFCMDIANFITVILNFEFIICGIWKSGMHPALQRHGMNSFQIGRCGWRCWWHSQRYPWMASARRQS